MKHIGNDERNRIKFMLGYCKKNTLSSSQRKQTLSSPIPVLSLRPVYLHHLASTPLSCIFSPTPFSYTTFPHTLLNSSPTPISYATFPPSPLSYATHQPLSYTSLPPRSLTPPPRPKATPLPRNQSVKPHSPL